MESCAQGLSMESCAQGLSGESCAQVLSMETCSQCFTIKSCELPRIGPGKAAFGICPDQTVGHLKENLPAEIKANIRIN